MAVLYHKPRLLTGEYYVRSQGNTCFSYKKKKWKNFLRVLRLSNGNDHTTGASYSLFIIRGMANLQLETAASHKYSLAPTQIKEKLVIDN